MLRKLTMSIAATTLLVTAAHAEPGTIRKDVQVFYHPTDLSTDAGAHLLLARINEAAREACGGAALFYGTYDVAPGLARKDFAKCQASAVSTAVSQLNAPLLTKAYALNGDGTLRLAGR